MGSTESEVDRWDLSVVEVSLVEQRPLGRSLAVHPTLVVSGVARMVAEVGSQ